MDEVSVLVAENLKFHMMGVGYIFFDQYVVIAKGVQRLSSCCLNFLRQIIFLPDDAHPFAAPTCGSFDQNRITNLLCSLFKIPFTL